MPRSDLNTDAGFGAFYDRHWKYVYRLCYTYMKNETDAEDCAEDVFVKILSGSFVFENEEHERKWLTVTSANLCKDKLKSYARKNVRSLDDETTQEPVSPEPEDNSDVLEAVMNLPPKLKDVIWMYYYEGYSTDEISVALGRRPSTVRNQMRDARVMLKKLLEGNAG